MEILKNVCKIFKIVLTAEINGKKIYTVTTGIITKNNP